MERQIFFSVLRSQSLRTTVLHSKDNYFHLHNFSILQLYRIKKDHWTNVHYTFGWEQVCAMYRLYPAVQLSDSIIDCEVSGHKDSISAWSDSTLFHKDPLQKQSYYRSTIPEFFLELFVQINGLIPTLGPLEIVLSVCAQLHQRRSAVVAEILLTLREQRISTMPVAINFVFLISPIVSKREKKRWMHSAGRLPLRNESLQRNRAKGSYGPLSPRFYSNIEPSVWIQQHIQYKLNKPFWTVYFFWSVAFSFQGIML